MRNISRDIAPQLSGPCHLVGIDIEPRTNWQLPLSRVTYFWAILSAYDRVQIIEHGLF